MSDDVAIIGVGLHPFGRFPGKSAIEMGADAARLAMKDAGVEWRDVQFAFGGSYEVDNPDAVVNLARARPASRSSTCTTAAPPRRARCTGGEDHPPRRVRHRHGDRHGQAPARRVLGRPGRVQPAGWYGETGHVPHAEVLRHEDPALHARLTASAAPDAGQGGGEELPQRVAQRERVPAHADVGRGADPRVADASTTRSPSTCSAPRRGRRGASCCAGPTIAHRYTVDTDLPAGRRRCAPGAIGAFEVHSPSIPLDRVAGPTVEASRAAYETAGIGPEDVDVDPAAGHRRRRRGVSTWPRTGSAPTATRSS